MYPGFHNIMSIKWNESLKRRLLAWITVSGLYVLVKMLKKVKMVRHEC